MLVPFLIMLREGLEAALIVGIVAGYISRSGRGAWMPAVWSGIFLAVALSLFVGAGLQLASAEFPQRTQELFEALVGFVAVAILTSMVLWMRKAARSLKAELQGSIDQALSGTRAQGLALVGLVFFAVAREGWIGLLPSRPLPAEPRRGRPARSASRHRRLGLLGAAIYAGGVRLDLSRFFRWTGVFILVVAAGLLAGSLRHLHEAGVWNALQATVVDLTPVLPVDSALGSVLSGLFGYMADPNAGELLAYVAYLVVTLRLFLRPAASPAQAPARPAAALH